MGSNYSSSIVSFYNPIIFQIVMVMFLLYLSSFFSSSETSMSMSNRIKIKTLADEGNVDAKRALKFIEEPEKFLSAILVGNNIVNLSASAIVTTLAIDVFGNAMVGVVTGILTLFILVFGEIMPKLLATNDAENILIKNSYILDIFVKLLSPIVVIVNFITNIILKIFSIDIIKKNNLITENDIINIINVSHEEGTIEEQDKNIIDNVFDFKKAYAKDVMVPKIDVVFINVDSTFEEVINIFKDEQYTRYPIYEGDSSNVIGIINIKDLLMYNNYSNFNIRDILRQPYYTFEYKKTSELMIEMREDKKNLRVNIAIVLDEYGACVGLISLEDMLEELVGEIRDEYDEHEKLLIQKVGQDEYLIEASMKLDDINEELLLYDNNLELESKEYDSIGGLLIELLDTIPKQDDFVITDKKVKIIAYKVVGNRIEKVKLCLKEALEEINLDKSIDE